MRKAQSKSYLREVWSDATTAGLFARVLAPLFVRHLIESLEVGERVRGRLPSPRESRVRRSLRLGSYAVGLAAAGALAVRLASHRDAPGSDSVSTIDS